jgi:DNA-binding response OmpR family regulator
MVTSSDATHRHLLLEASGHDVNVTSAHLVPILLREEKYDLALITLQEHGSNIVPLCERIKRDRPDMMVAVIAQESEPVPHTSAIDAVIRSQQHPGQFLAAVATLLDSARSNVRFRSASDGQ